METCKMYANTFQDGDGDGPLDTHSESESKHLFDPINGNRKPNQKNYYYYLHSNELYTLKLCRHHRFHSSFHF